jgi:hypothetical protein
LEKSGIALVWNARHRPSARAGRGFSIEYDEYVGRLPMLTL